MAEALMLAQALNASNFDGAPTCLVNAAKTPSARIGIAAISIALAKRSPERCM
jgi:hypothetical protein